jgi:hypothetical protein
LEDSIGAGPCLTSASVPPVAPAAERSLRCWPSHALRPLARRLSCSSVSKQIRGLFATKEVAFSMVREVGRRRSHGVFGAILP